VYVRKRLTILSLSIVATTFSATPMIGLTRLSIDPTYSTFAGANIRPMPFLIIIILFILIV